METQMRPELSKRSKYYLEKHRYYELKHFCLQYNVWKKAYYALEGLSKSPSELRAITSRSISDPTAKAAEAKLFYRERFEMIEHAAKEADPELSEYILRGVTESLPYENLVAKMDIPCSRDTYYDRYRKFFWLLSNARK